MIASIILLIMIPAVPDVTEAGTDVWMATSILPYESILSVTIASGTPETNYAYAGGIYGVYKDTNCSPLWSSTAKRLRGVSVPREDLPRKSHVIGCTAHVSASIGAGGTI